jgi:hypothetical protein
MANAAPSEANLHKAIGFYRKALARDASYALAYAGLADATVTWAIWARCLRRTCCRRPEPPPEQHWSWTTV